MKKVYEIFHDKPFDELKTKIVEKIESFKNNYSEKVSSYGINHFLDEENKVLTVRCEKFNLNWYVAFLPNIIQIYEEIDEAPAYIKMLIPLYRKQLMSTLHDEFQKIIN